MAVQTKKRGIHMLQTLMQTNAVLYGMGILCILGAVSQLILGMIYHRMRKDVENEHTVSKSPFSLCCAPAIGSGQTSASLPSGNGAGPLLSYDCSCDSILLSHHLPSLWGSSLLAHSDRWL